MHFNFFGEKQELQKRRKKKEKAAPAAVSSWPRQKRLLLVRVVVYDFVIKNSINIVLENFCVSPTYRLFAIVLPQDYYYYSYLYYTWYTVVVSKKNKDCKNIYYHYIVYIFQSIFLYKTGNLPIRNILKVQ